MLFVWIRYFIKSIIYFLGCLASSSVAWGASESQCQSGSASESQCECESESDSDSATWVEKVRVRVRGICESEREE